MKPWNGRNDLKKHGRYKIAHAMSPSSDMVPFAPELIQFIRRILSVAETDKPVWNPSEVFVYADGDHDRRQVTLSIKFTEDGGNLRPVIERYIDKNGTLMAKFPTFLPLIATGVLASNDAFKKLLKDAGQDPLMMEAQEELFDEKYLGPAFRWAKKYGFTMPLSFLVIADSFLHSGSVPEFLTNRFPEKKPKDGGDEKAWIHAYLKTRRSWLAGHSNSLLHKTVYRCDCYQKESARHNWEMAMQPITMHGTAVHPA
jgi:chitosanase